MGYRSTTAQLFTVPPNMTAFITVIITAFASDKLKNRGYFVIAGSILGICGYTMMLVAKTNAVRYAGTFLVAVGVFQGSPMIMVRKDPHPLLINTLLMFRAGMGIEQPRAALREGRGSGHHHFHRQLLGLYRHLCVPGTRCAKVRAGPFC